MANVLVIGNQTDLHTHLVRMLVPNGHSLTAVSSVSEGIHYCGKGACDLVVIEDDLAAQVPTGVASFRATGASPQVVVVTEKADPKLGENALLEGALNYMRKGAAPRAISTLLDRMAVKTVGSDIDDAPPTSDFGIYGSSPRLRSVFDLIYRSRASDISVLIQGETGTGKELFAKAIHKLSLRRDGPLVTVDCASLPEQLVESLLFGYSQGAFTGAARSREGLIKQADGGTLFLDEVGELPLSLQKKFLRVLQERRFRPVGGGQEVHSDFRLIAATNRDLHEMIRQKLFRDDLLYRLRTLKIELPLLRERGHDVIEIAEQLLRDRAQAAGTAPRQMSAEFKARLLAYDWPGNVRELVNVIESTLAVAQDGETLFVEQLPSGIHARMIQSSCIRWSQDGTDPMPEAEHSPSSNGAASAEGAFQHAEPPVAVAERGPRRGPKRGDGRRVTPEASLPSPQDLGGVSDSPKARPQPMEKNPAMLPLPSFREGRREALEAFEQTYLANLHAVAKADIRQAGALSNLSRARVYELYRKYNIAR
ncbi:sigma-54 dependent transcriptional regulator [Nitratidesulfovibrio sp.]|uniref:sigma-54 dependent transcriptional regulator n=1 Tax=Nitratidesulfovibrio sp. TaxID=2802297 RepID=UPI003340E392